MAWALCADGDASTTEARVVHVCMCARKRACAREDDIVTSCV